MKASPAERLSGFLKENPVFCAVPLASALIFYWFLPEFVHCTVSSNDVVLHASIVRRMSEAWGSGGDIFDFWLRNVGPGHAFVRTSHFLLYLLSLLVYKAPFLGWSIERSLMALVLLTVVVLPWSLYAGGRLLGLSVAESSVAAALLPLLRDVRGYGISVENYTWSSGGIVNQAFALLSLPIALGLIYRALKGRNLIIPAAVCYSVTWMSHLFQGYMAFIWSIVCAAFLIATDRKRWADIFGRWAGIQVLFSIISCGLIIPILQDRFLQLRSLDEPLYRFQGLGARQILFELGRGKLFDANFAVPFVSVLAVCGFFYCAYLFFRNRPGREEFMPGLIAAELLAALVLAFGPVTSGGLISLLPFGDDIHWHRFLVLVHLMSLYAAGIFAVAAWRALSAKAAEAAATAAVVVAAVVCINLLAINGYYYGVNARNLRIVEKFWNADKEFHRILDFTLSHDDARIYPGTEANYGDKISAAGYPLYAVLSEFDADAISILYHALGISGPLDFAIDFKDPGDVRLVNVRYVVLPAGMKAPARYVPLIKGDVSTLYDNGNTEGFFMAGTPSPGGCADSGILYSAIHQWVKDPAQDAGIFPEVVMTDGCPPMSRRLTGTGLDVSGSRQAGRVLKSGVDRVPGGRRYWADMIMDAPGLIVFKMEYHPSWRVLLNGRPARTFMVMPGFSAVSAGKGSYHVEAQYVSSGLRKWLLLFGALFAAGAMFYWLKRRDSSLPGRTASPAAAGQPKRRR